jgi:hypothetical protein
MAGFQHDIAGGDGNLIVNAVNENTTATGKLICRPLP